MLSALISKSIWLIYLSLQRNLVIKSLMSVKHLTSVGSERKNCTIETENEVVKPAINLSILKVPTEEATKIHIKITNSHSLKFK